MKYNTLKRISILLAYNRLLSSRIKRSVFFSRSIILIFLLFTVGLSLYYVFIELKIKPNHLDMEITYIIMILIMIYLMMIFLRYATGTIITPEKLLVLPNSKMFLYNYMLVNSFFNEGTLIFMFPILIISIGFLKFGIKTALESFIILLGYFIVLEIWILNIYILFIKYFSRHKKNLTAIPSLILIFLILSDRIIGYQNITKVPYLGSAGKILLKLTIGDLSQFILLLFVHVLSAITGIIIGRLLIIKKQMV